MGFFNDLYHKIKTILPGNSNEPLAISSEESGKLKAIAMLEIQKRDQKIAELQSEVQRLNAQIHESNFDKLTGLLSGDYYHSKYSQIADAISEMAKQSSQELDSEIKPNCSVVYADINNLKMINDSQGHDVGDEGMIAIISIIKSVLDSYPNMFFRIGGDEFIIILPNMDKSSVEEAIISKANDLFTINQDKLNGLGIAMGTASLDEVLEKLQEPIDMTKQKGEERKSLEMLIAEAPKPKINDSNNRKTTRTPRKRNRFFQALMKLAEDRMFGNKKDTKDMAFLDSIIDESAARTNRARKDPQSIPETQEILGAFAGALLETIENNVQDTAPPKLDIENPHDEHEGLGE